MREFCCFFPGADKMFRRVRYSTEYGVTWPDCARVRQARLAHSESCLEQPPPGCATSWCHHCPGEFGNDSFTYVFLILTPFLLFRLVMYCHPIRRVSSRPNSSLTCYIYFLVLMPEMYCHPVCRPYSVITSHGHISFWYMHETGAEIFQCACMVHFKYFVLPLTVSIFYTCRPIHYYW